MHTELDVDEIKMLEQLTAVMARLLFVLNGVTAINLYDVPTFADEPQTRSHVQRLLVVVSEEQYAAYEERLLNPAIISRQDSDDSGNGWFDEAEETPDEATFHHLGTTRESYSSRVDVEMAAVTGEPFDLVACDIVDVILVPPSWTEKAASQLERTYTDINHVAHVAIIPDREGRFALSEYRVFNQETGTFSKP